MKGLVDARMVKSAKQFDRAVQAAEQAVQLKAQVGEWAPQGDCFLWVSQDGLYLQRQNMLTTSGTAQGTGGGVGLGLGLGAASCR